MTDRRLTPANARVAAVHLRGQVAADTYVEGEPATMGQVVTDLLDAPMGRRDRQLQLGASVKVYERRDGWAFVQADRDGYVGYVAEDALTVPQNPTHFVATPATHVYEDESFKSPDRLHLPFGSALTVLRETEKMVETPLGFVPKPHLKPVEYVFSDPVTVAQIFLGVPYLWGGNSTRGIDCSGLVQAAYLACGIDCAGDSDLQEARFGEVLAQDALLQRGDLIFWKGHVAMMVDTEVLIHANAFHMAVAYEGLAEATARIKAQGDGEITARRRA